MYLGEGLARQEEAESVPFSLQRKRWERKGIRQEDWLWPPLPMGKLYNSKASLTFEEKLEDKLWRKKWWWQDNTSSAIVSLGREAPFVSFLPVSSYSLPRLPQLQCGRYTKDPHSQQPLRDVKMLELAGGTGCQRKSPERWWDGKASRLCCERQSTFPFPCAVLGMILNKTGPASRKESEYLWVLLASECQDSQQRFGEVPLALDFVRTLEGTWLIMPWWKTAQIQGPPALCGEDQPKVKCKVRAPDTKCSKDNKGFPLWRHHLGKKERVP